ncbi:LPS export ABC transporter periplasmic protein LptC [Celeribacter arenosi]|uniref:LPS export ABC transporter periplasmic protein LptC n=1 Tax=Celeribacter arenosi TaxID=792649 RepID=A0ABP7JXJ1_9RHOB
MARYDNSHSRFVAYAKVILPLASLAILATLFLFSRRPDTTSTIPYARVDIETLAREQRLDGASFATVLTDGGELSLNADRVRPDLSNNDVINGSTISGELALPDGTTVTLTANDGVIDGPGRVAELSGSVVVRTSSAYSIKTDRIAALLDASKIESPGAVDAEGPAGTIHAGSMEISEVGVDKQYQLVFKNGVRLIYQP